MGKPTGFMDYKRQELARRPPQERIKDWEEIKTSSLPHKEELQKQAARCMDCGIPFCRNSPRTSVRLPVKEPAVPAWQAVQSVSAILNNISLKQHLQKAMSNPTSRLTAADKKLPLSAAARPAWPVPTSLTRQATASPSMNVPTAPGGF